jgi:hypothetical protein
MATHGYPVKGLSTQTVDMNTVPLGRRGRREAARTFHEAGRGGHFAAWEEPEIFTDEVRAAFRELR